MTKPSPTDATTKLDAARTAVRDHIKDLIDWQSAMTMRGNETAANKALSHFNELREVSNQLDTLVRTWNELIIKQQGPVTPTPVKAPEVSPVSKPATTLAPHSKRPATKLRVTFPDGTVIEEKTAAATLVEFVKWVGVERVMTVNLRVDGHPFVSLSPDTKHSLSSWKPLGDYYVGTHTNNIEKREQIIKIGKALGLTVQVEIQ